MSVATIIRDSAFEADMIEAARQLLTETGAMDDPQAATADPRFHARVREFCDAWLLTTGEWTSLAFDARQVETAHRMHEFRARTVTKWFDDASTAILVDAGVA